MINKRKTFNFKNELIRLLGFIGILILAILAIGIITGCERGPTNFVEHPENIPYRLKIESYVEYPGRPGEIFPIDMAAPFIINSKNYMKYSFGSFTLDTVVYGTTHLYYGYQLNRSRDTLIPYTTTPGIPGRVEIPTTVKITFNRDGQPDKVIYSGKARVHGFEFYNGKNVGVPFQKSRRKAVPWTRR